MEIFANAITETNITSFPSDEPKNLLITEKNLNWEIQKPSNNMIKEKTFEDDRIDNQLNTEDMEKYNNASKISCIEV